MNSNNYQYLLFDWDGCLADTLSIWMESYLYVYNEIYHLNVNVSDVIAKSWGNWEKGAQNLGIKDYQKCMDLILERVLGDLPQVNLNPQVFETLQSLQEKVGLKMAVISSSKQNQVFPALKNLQIDHFFDVVLCEEDVQKTKPDPEIVYKSMKSLGAEVSNTLIIGDSSGDVLAGQKVGIDTVLYYPEINHRYYTKSKLQELHSSFFITDFSEILKLLN